MPVTPWQDYRQRAHLEGISLLFCRDVFQFVGDFGMTSSGNDLRASALTANQWRHRIGVLATLISVSACVLVWLRLPPPAVTHNVESALSLMSLVMLNFALFRRSLR